MQKLFSVTEAAEYLGVSRQTVYKYIRNGIFPQPTGSYGEREAPLFSYESMFQFREKNAKQL
jgi:predicted site-specific integrase-resolvase